MIMHSKRGDQLGGDRHERGTRPAAGAEVEGGEDDREVRGEEGEPVDAGQERQRHEPERPHCRQGYHGRGGDLKK